MDDCSQHHLDHLILNVFFFGHVVYIAIFFVILPSHEQQDVYKSSVLIDPNERLVFVVHEQIDIGFLLNDSRQGSILNTNKTMPTGYLSVCSVQ
jgi:hypothetical protein